MRVDRSGQRLSGPALRGRGKLLRITMLLAGDFNVRCEANSDAGRPFMASQGFLS
jgi:hypothetical protein